MHKTYINQLWQLFPLQDGISLVTTNNHILASAHFFKMKSARGKKERKIYLLTIPHDKSEKIALCSVPNNFLPVLSREISGTRQFGFSPSESVSLVGCRAKGPALSTSANVNTAIPPQLETLNALDSVQYQGWSMQLMQS